MDYMLNRYFFAYLPFNVSEEWKRSITSTGMTTVKVADWFCKTQDLWNFYTNNVTFLGAEIVYPLFCLLTFVHAYRHSGRYFYTWIGIALYAMIACSLCFAHQFFDNQWHAQGLLTYFGGRAPLSALYGVQQLAFYTAFIFVQRMHLPWWAQGPGTGIGVLLIKLPYYIMGNKLLWWTWHSDDPVFSDKIYGFPWFSLALDVACANSFVSGLQLTRKFLLKEFYDWKRFGREFICALSATVFALFLGFLQCAILYSFAYFTGIPVYLTTLAYISLNAIAVNHADRRNRNPDGRVGNPYWFDELSLAISLHFIFLMILVLVAIPETGNIVSPGMHQPIGPCTADTKFKLPFGMVIERSTYLCPKEVSSQSGNCNFDFHCIPGVTKTKPPKFGSDIVEWYAICGVPTSQEQRAELTGVIWSICLIAAAILYQAAANSGKTPRVYAIIYRSPTGNSKKNK